MLIALLQKCEKSLYQLVVDQTKAQILSSQMGLDLGRYFGNGRNDLS